MKLVWSAMAVQQFTQLFEYIATQDAEMAERIANEIDEAALSLLDFPEMGSPGSVQALGSGLSPARVIS